MASRTASWAALAAACLVAISSTNALLAFSASPPGPAVPPAQQTRVLAAGNLRGATSTAAPGSSAASMCGAVAAAALAMGGLAATRQQRRSDRAAACAANAFSSGSSSFMGTPTVTSYVANGVVPVLYEAPEDDYSKRSGVAGLGMKAQVWWIKNNGYDGLTGGKIYDSVRRESRRRGEELFRHDVDNFELTMHNLICAPGSRKKKIRRGRGKYGHHGRTCGYGVGGAKKRGRRTLNPGYEGGNTPLHRRVPKLREEDFALEEKDSYNIVYISIKDLNMLDDGDEVDYMDLVVRGIPVMGTTKRFGIMRRLTKVKSKEKDVLTVKNLTVFAHAFEPGAREKIEANGGRCVRLHEWAGIPLDPDAVKVNVSGGLDDGKSEAAEGEGSEE